MNDDDIMALSIALAAWRRSLPWYLRLRITIRYWCYLAWFHLRRWWRRACEECGE